MRFKGLDLNLLGVFDMLMHTRSVSRTAERLNMSQPAVSSALKRLREYFDDDILVLHGKRLFPTAFAEGLTPQIREGLRHVEALVATSAAFDPATSRRTFRLCGSDYMATAVFARLARDLADIAPGVRLEILLNDDQSVHQLEQGAIDLLVMPDTYMEHALPAEHLLDERLVVVGWSGNPLLPDALDDAAFMAAGHVQTAIGYGRALVFGDKQLEMAGRHRRVEMIASSFTIVPWLLIETQRLALMHERLARLMAARHPLAIAPVPFEVPVMREMIQFHPSRLRDPGLAWLRDRMRDAVRPVGEPASA